MGRTPTCRVYRQDPSQGLNMHNCLRTLLPALALALVASAAACSSSTTPTTPTTTPTTTLSGTFDIVAAYPLATKDTATLTISSTEFTFAEGSGSFSFHQTGADVGAVYKTDQSATIAVTNARGATRLDQGILPLALDGDWTFENDAKKCAMRFVDGLLTAGCDERPSFPSPFSNPETGAAYTLKRTSKAASVFGTFGGEWSATGPGSGSCVLHFTDHTVHAACANGSGADGSFEVTVAGDLASATGKTSDGYEFSARRH